ncbi:hypothetical protein K9N50_12050 [bacterium]|nr:hypothetical protein [bacterium]
MKRLFIVLALIFAVGSVFAGDDDALTDRLFAPETVPLMLTESGMSTSGSSQGNVFSDFWAPKNPEDLNPGKALLLSAIMPGTGELYAGNKLKAAIFFGVEVLAWTGVVYFYGQGKDKEDEFMDFADVNFDPDKYREYEFRLAGMDYGDSGAYNGDMATWTELSWDAKITYLPKQGFTHELPTDEEREDDWSLDQQFYEMIGKYIHQFGVGWLDAPAWDPNNPVNDYYAPYFNGTSLLSKEYMGMRDDSNKLLKYSAWGYNLALLNHVASALDASFSVKIAKRTAKADLGFKQVPYNNELVNTAGLTFTW